MPGVCSAIADGLMSCSSEWSPVRGLNGIAHSPSHGSATSTTPRKAVSDAVAVGLDLERSGMSCRHD